jgi:diguanylate cyclase (GGDEF)-like protein
VDDLKSVNDSYGHLAGDQMLLTIATVLRGTCRNSDIIGRFGGDEFVASYHLTDVPGMEKNIAAIRTRLRSKTMRFGNGEHRLSFSYGLASFPQDGTDQEALLAAADKRLYAMKSTEK